MMQNSNSSSYFDPRPREGEPIAIIGLSCRFPGAADAKAFWRLLRDGGEAITEIPAERWNVDDLYDPNLATPGKMNTRSGAFLEHIDEFDPLFFGISPREAASMDPQQRLMLEVSWEALEDAGLAPDRVRGTRTGVFVGICNNDYLTVQSTDLERINAYFPTGSILSMAANRVSNFLDLRGPSLAVDTACSSSLVAVHLACQSLRTGESNMAMAGGVNVILSPNASIALSQAWMMASDGRCKSFDADADGYVRGEGCGVVVLKRLADARREGNRILAVIRGTAVNQDGRGTGLTAPSRAAQEAVIRQALDDAGVTANEIDYVEAHGIGAPLADAIELQSLAAVLGEDRSADQPCLVGSVKPNIGHLETASGVSTLIKIVLSLQHAEIPPMLHLKNINPDVALDGASVRIATQLTSWPETSHARRAGIHSFGIGGTNAHLIVEQAPASHSETAITESPVHLLTLSARTEAALKQLALRYHDHLTQVPNSSPYEICFTANTGRANFSHRLAIKADSTGGLMQGLIDFTEKNPSAGIYERVVEDEARPKIAFVFGSSLALSECRKLYAQEPGFRRAIADCDRVSDLDGTTLIADVFSAQFDGDQLPDVALFACQYALAQMWIGAGVVPDAVLGEGPGEYVAACVARAISLKDGLKLAAGRGRVLDIPIRAFDLGVLMVSSVTGDAFVQPAGPNSEYWRRQSDDDGQFRRGLETLADTGHKIFLSIGETLDAASIRGCEWIPTLTVEGSIGEALIDAAARLYVAGADLKWAGFSGRSDSKLVSLPTYPFQRRRCWLDVPRMPASKVISEVKTVAAPDAQQNGQATRRLALGQDQSDLSGSYRRLQLTSPGSLNGLTLESAERCEPGPNEVEIRVHAAALNYRDTLVAMDVYPGGQVALGIECAGTIARVGSNVTRFAVGDEVIAIAPGSFADFVTTSADFVVMKPIRFSFAESATLPIAFLTVHYAMNHLARIAKGERVLIHAGAGGVGLAAVQVALRAGAEVLATAGSDEKRAFLKALGVKHTFSSRSLDFAEQVMECTEGRGVDVVLNSLAGPFLLKSLSVLAPYGRFLEIGKRDIFENSQLGMQIFEKNTAFFGIDLNPFFEDRPALIRSMLEELMESFNSGDLNPLPLRAFPIDEAVTAFRYLAKAKNIGKVVLDLVDNDAQRPQTELTSAAAAAHAPDPVAWRELILAADADQRQHLLEAYVCEQLSAALGLSKAELDVDAPLQSLGLDSLMALELKNRFEKEIDVTLPLSIFLEAPSIGQVTRALNGLLDGQGRGRSRSLSSYAAGDSASQLLARMDSFSDAEVDLLLKQMLNEGVSING